ncbi:hypothetical protein, partial [Paraglaciecola hydrolytica]|uniref:hypothetical protein n=1 Tax=Paraglaciecola hydrolytica TaxID=1799789 RepID=UPI001910726F
MLTNIKKNVLNHYLLVFCFLIVLAFLFSTLLNNLLPSFIPPYMGELRKLAALAGVLLGLIVNVIKFFINKDFKAEPYNIFAAILATFAFFATTPEKVSIEELRSLIDSAVNVQYQEINEENTAIASKVILSSKNPFERACAFYALGESEKALAELKIALEKEVTTEPEIEKYKRLLSKIKQNEGQNENNFFNKVVKPLEYKDKFNNDTFEQNIKPLHEEYLKKTEKNESQKEIFESPINEENSPSLYSKNQTETSLEKDNTLG